VSSRQQEEFLDRLLDSAELGVVVLDFDWQIASMNDWTTRKAADPAFHTAVLQPALHLRPRQNQPKSLQQDIFTGPGNRRYHVEAATFVDRGFERGFLIIQDVTTELLAAEKDAYGKVIRMMAHEVNNSNAAIVSLLRSILEAAEDEDPQLGGLNKDYLPVVINRAENMTTFMRNFARVIRLPTAERKRVDLNELLHRTGEVMATVLADYNIELRYTLHPDPVFVLADPSHLEQVVVNALTNARESIGKAGVIRISTSAFPASFVIADDGPGIPEAVADKLFTPFYSTKPTGQGVGLTLTRDILEAHGASYSLRTEEDGWTRLMVKFLPEN
ncbi:MAG: HAMP domain-containing sensor histidine kinase, partial [Bacteroidota bacterium]